MENIIPTTLTRQLYVLYPLIPGSINDNQVRRSRPMFCSSTHASSHHSHLRH